jgi:hypothetical protein
MSWKIAVMEWYINYSRGNLYEVPFATLLKETNESGTEPQTLANGLKVVGFIHLIPVPFVIINVLEHLLQQVNLLKILKILKIRWMLPSIIQY